MDEPLLGMGEPPLGVGERFLGMGEGFLGMGPSRLGMGPCGRGIGESDMGTERWWPGFQASGLRNYVATQRRALRIISTNSLSEYDSFVCPSAVYHALPPSNSWHQVTG